MSGKFFLDDRLKKFRRRTAVILPKDIGIIIGISALSKNDEVVEIGGGSGYGTFYLARIARRVYVYERRIDVFEDLKYNLRDFDNVEIYNIDGKEANHYAYLYVIDSPEAMEILDRVHIYIQKWVFVYVPNITQAKEIYMKIKSLGFKAYLVRNFLEEWEVDEKILKPKHKQLYHTGFLVIGEK
ncbi:MAG: rRNA adenine N-6-methyltransferase family protein [Candidatus Anstonellales archaeon]